MEQLGEKQAMELFEQGSSLSPLGRGILMMAAWGRLSWEDAERLPIVQRDRGLIDMRIRLFGPEIEFAANCPDCDESYEGSFDLTLVPQPGPQEVAVELDAQNFRLRAPTSRCMAQALERGSPTRLLKECVDSSDPCWAQDDELLEAVEKALTESFPLLDIRLGVHCLDCDKVFPVRFDIVSWLWRDIESLARSAMDSVDLLARAYGWSESDVLGISPARRAHYIGKVRA